MEFITLAEQWPPEWQRLISETIVVVPTLSLWPHQIIIMAASQGKKKEPFLLLFFYLVSVTWQSSFECEFASLECNILYCIILYCIINLVFCIPLIWFLCKCLKSTQIYWVALNAFYKESLNNRDTKRAFILPRNSGCWHISAWRKMFCFCSTSNILTCYWYFSFFYYCYTAPKEMNFCFKLVFE